MKRHVLIVDVAYLELRCNALCVTWSLNTLPSCKTTYNHPKNILKAPHYTVCDMIIYIIKLVKELLYKADNLLCLRKHIGC